MFKGVARLLTAVVVGAVFGSMPVPSAWSQPLQPGQAGTQLSGDRVVVGSSLVLGSGETLAGSVAVLAGQLLIAQGATVEGDVVVIGGSAQIDGTVRGDVSLVGGDMALGQSARIEGDLVRLSGALKRHPAAGVAGMVVDVAPLSIGIAERNIGGLLEGRLSQQTEEQPWRWLELILNPFLNLLGVVLITLFAVAVAALAPSNLAQASRDLRAYPLLSLGVGALTLVAVPLGVALLAITICFIPLAAVVVIAFALLILLGWVVVANLIGERLWLALGRPNVLPLVQTASGALLLALLGSAPILGGVLSAVSVAFGLGALIITRLGAQPYVPVQPLSPRTTV
ncbi:MAG: polymer-forming cytoskeletal protein [Anaerolineae bacterium]|nr:polymer-forming cytoskeletal protein [Thermoflexales bacterium]MDW8396410.1 polymer-forming cytoskeletal protein [Anaerolineae bacterium]